MESADVSRDKERIVAVARNKGAGARSWTLSFSTLQGLLLYLATVNLVNGGGEHLECIPYQSEFR